LKIGRIVVTSRPVTWFIAPLIYFWGIKQGGGSISPFIVLEMILLSFPYCLFLFGVNDWYDFKSDQVNRRKNGIEGARNGKWELQKMRVLFWIAPLLLGLMAIATGHVMHIASVTLLLLVSYFYSAPPRLKCRLILDSISNGLIVLLIFLMGYTLGYKESIPSQIWTLFFGTAGSHLLAAALDYQPDLKAGYKTTAVRIGVNKSVIIAFLYLFIALFISKLPIDVMIAFGLLCSLGIVYLIVKKEIILHLNCWLTIPTFLLFISHLVFNF